MNKQKRTKDQGSIVDGKKGIDESAKFVEDAPDTETSQVQTYLYVWFKVLFRFTHLLFAPFVCIIWHIAEIDR